MSDAVNPPSAWSRFTGWVSRALNLGDTTVPTVAESKPIPAGAAFGSGLSTPPQYAPASALYAVSQSPWLHAAIAAKAADLSAIPIVVESMTGEPIKKHPVIDLLNNSNGKRAISHNGTIAIRPISRRELIEQWVVDLSTGGNAYGHVLTFGEPNSLVWLAPTRVQPITNHIGSIAGYAVDDGGGFGGSSNLPCAEYGVSGIVSAHRFRARYDAVDVTGMAPVAPLDAVLTADFHATRRSAESSRKGRPDAIAAPPAGAPALNPIQVAQAQESLTRAFNAQDQGVAVVSGSVEITPLAWSPKEMEEAQRASMSRAAVLAVTGVPPVRLGLETANFATAREQSTQYWRGLVGLAAQLEDLLNMLGACYTPPVRLRFDFGGVSALQEDRGARLDRVAKHIANGMAPIRAYALEGFREVVAEDMAPDTGPGATGQPSASVDVAIGDLLDAVDEGDPDMIAEAADALRAAVDEAQGANGG